MRIVIIGAGFGGLNAAVTLQKKLNPSQHEILIISDNPQFVFRPSLIWLPFHKHSIDRFTFPLRPTFEKMDITFIENRVQAIKPKKNYILCKNGEIIHYDFLILASGASPDWRRIKGLEGESSSVYTISSALKTRKKVEELTENEPIVIGIAQGNPNQGIAYEFLFELDAFLNKQDIKCPITFFTYEKKLFEGKGKKGTARIEELMAKKQIKWYCDVSVKKIRGGHVYLNNGKHLPYSFTHILPPYKGKEFVFSSKGFKHDHGILPVKETLQSVQWDNVFVVGDANDIKGAKTGRAAEQQGILAAENIVKQLNHEPLLSYQHEQLFLTELGNEGAMLILNKLNDNGILKGTISGIFPHLLKRAFEKYYMFKYS
ncbi:FAD-dependent oxidoreductase [Bacillus sp. ISL-47]|uniref:NAD(P)/FAD-dependent oxidoreductase n=1 Tax=Bacillus sp. ISL-47 TaxID=2819130 RepID=UPI001BE56B3E|nr:FAD-dependent oxidoreductase [Bacillus sp. ISL-47]MBT2686637.1 FAD-dependent oxidoreductase [Bacillus sp. ISL-47]MBT2707029.1 FAD-dependent oxidoreductase [Pseudomonas sp. ISL-84]